MISLITAALSVLALLLEVWMKTRKTAQEKRYDEIQQGRDDIAAGNVDAINSRIDRLLSSQVNHASGERGQGDLEKRTSSVQGVVVTGRGAGPNS